MPRSGGAVIPMQLNFNELQYVVGTAETAEEMKNAAPLRPFDDGVIAFLSDLSAVLRTNRSYPDVATFGFWCRKAALMQEKAKYNDIDERFGRGIIFHSTPSNVPVNFAFSFASGLLAGNANIVRLPGRSFEQVDIICDAVRQLLTDKYSALAPYVCFVKYPTVREINDAFSGLCSVRVIWGGDGTISEMRKSPLSARATEITFADRHSAAVIDAGKYLEAENKDIIAQDFYNDTYYTDQNACTSPRIVFWLGSDTEAAKSDFWGRIHALAKERYSLAPVQSVGKLNALCRAAAVKPLKLVKSEDMLVVRLTADDIGSDLMDFKYNSGFFFEKDITDLSEMLPVCGERCQTLSYFGVSEDTLRKFIRDSRPYGIDRIVPIGKTMDFSLIWDGYDLIRQMSRRISII